MRAGQNLKIGGQMSGPMLPLAGVALNGTYAAHSFGGGRSSVSGGFDHALTFTRQGRFSQHSSGVSATFTDTGTPSGTVTGGVAASTQDGSGGTYRATGYTMELKYTDGHTQQVAFALPDKAGEPDLTLLRLGGSTYTLEHGKH